MQPDSECYASPVPLTNGSCATVRPEKKKKKKKRNMQVRKREKEEGIRKDLACSEGHLLSLCRHWHEIASSRFRLQMTRTELRVSPVCKRRECRHIYQLFAVLRSSTSFYLLNLLISKVSIHWVQSLSLSFLLYEVRVLVSSASSGDHRCWQTPLNANCSVPRCDQQQLRCASSNVHLVTVCHRWRHRSG